MNDWSKLASEESIQNAIAKLKENGIEALVVKNGKAAKAKVLELLPKGAEVMNMTSVTLDTISLSKEINKSGNYDSVRQKLNSMERETQGQEMQRIGAAPKYAIGSVHAVTEDGKVMISSNTGSQLSAYAYGSLHIIWVVGTQKIVKNLDEGFKRIYEYVLPLEDKRAQKAYGSGSNVSKLLIVNKEVNEGRLTMIFVKENLGF